MTPQDVKDALQSAELGLDAVLPLAGHAELVPLVDVVTRILQKLTDAVAAKGAEAPVLATEIATADAAADEAERAKFGGKP